MFLDEYQCFTRSMPTIWAPESATLTFVTLAYFIVFFFLVVLAVRVWPVGATPNAHFVLVQFINILLSFSCQKKKTCLELSVNYPTWESNKADSSKLPCFPTISPPIYGGDLEISNQTQLFLLFIDNISKF